MPEQLRAASARRGLDSAGRTLGSEGRAVCLRATAQRSNDIIANGVRPSVLNIRQPVLLGRSVGGKHHGDPLMEQTASPLGGALAGGKGTHNE